MALWAALFIPHRKQCMGGILWIIVCLSAYDSCLLNRY